MATATVHAYRGTKTGHSILPVTIDQVVSGFTKTNNVRLVAVSGNGDTDVKLTISPDSGQNYQFVFVFPEGKMGQFRIEFTGTVQVSSVSESLEGDSVTITYDTLSSVTATFSNIRFDDDGLLVVDIDFGEDILHFHKTDLDVKWLLGDSIFDLEYYLVEVGGSQSNRKFMVKFEVPDGVYGAFSLGFLGYVFKTSDVIRNDVISTPILVYYDTRSI